MKNFKKPENETQIVELKLYDARQSKPKHSIKTLILSIYQFSANGET